GKSCPPCALKKHIPQSVEANTARLFRGIREGLHFAESSLADRTVRYHRRAAGVNPCRARPVTAA
ncbi:MAG: hypothetical protein RSA17_10435, partial [Ruthenibacterium sp.]